MNVLFFRITLFSIFSLLQISPQICSAQIRKNFILDGVIHGDYKGYIYMFYGNKKEGYHKDSVYVEHVNKFQFRGNVPHPTGACFGTEDAPTEKHFFIENTAMKIDISIARQLGEQKTMQNIISVNSITGTKSGRIQKDFADFELKHKKDKDWNTLLFDKLMAIVTQNPDSGYSGVLIDEISNGNILNNKQLIEIYRKLDKNFQDDYILQKIDKKLFKIGIVNVGDYLIDFKLKNTEGKIQSPKDYRGSFLLIDFWASWCSPCRAQFPEMKRIYDEFKNAKFQTGNKFKILGVSIDDDKEKWKSAVAKDSISWDNVNEKGSFNAKTAIKYGVEYVPFNVLISPSGCIVAKDLTPEKLEKFLSNNLKK